jgi:hypothetical protein
MSILLHFIFQSGHVTFQTKLFENVFYHEQIRMNDIWEFIYEYIKTNYGQAKLLCII